MRRSGFACVPALCLALLVSLPFYGQQQPSQNQPETRGPQSQQDQQNQPETRGPDSQQAGQDQENQQTQDPQSQGQQNQNQPEYQGPDTPQGAQEAPPPPPPSAPAPQNVIPEGTSIAIRTNENINTSDAGSSYSAEIRDDVLDPNGQVLIPRHSPARLMVVNTAENNSGKNLALALQSIRVNGHNYQVVTNTTNGGAGGTGIGKNKRTGEYVGGGAVLGTVIGAIAGGGKGAAIGAIAGGAGGAGAQVLTKGKQINVPAESVLTFRLDQPLQLR
jgi:hypothetical protein